MAKNLCPCGSGLRYPECCRPFHRGAEPQTAAALMRARFCAYAQGELDFLVRTLDAGHEDRGRPADELTRQLRASIRAVRYARLSVLGDRPGAGPGHHQVLFFAELYEAGKPRGFAELSDFRHDGTGWRYWKGTLRPLPALPADPARLSLAEWDLLPALAM